MWLIRRAEAVILTTCMLIVPALGAVALHRLSALGWLTIDWSDPLGWIARTSPEDMAAAILRHLGLAGCYWLSTASIAYTAGRLAGLSRVVAALRPLTPGIVRSVADRVVIGAVALSSLGVSPASAMTDHLPVPIVEPIELRATVGEITAEAPGGIAFVRDDYLPYVPHTPSRPATSHEPGESTAKTPGTVASVRNDYLPHDFGSPNPSAPGTQDRETVEVHSGDSLWLIASRHLARHLGRPPTPDEVRPHWHSTIEANLPHLRSADPDLIHPGEIITLPTRES